MLTAFINKRFFLWIPPNYVGGKVIAETDSGNVKVQLDDGNVVWTYFDNLLPEVSAA